MNDNSSQDTTNTNQSVRLTLAKWMKLFRKESYVATLSTLVRSFNTNFGKILTCKKMHNFNQQGKRTQIMKVHERVYTENDAFHKLLQRFMLTYHL